MLLLDLRGALVQQSRALAEQLLQSRRPQRTVLATAPVVRPSTAGGAGEREIGEHDVVGQRLLLQRAIAQDRREHEERGLKVVYQRLAQVTRRVIRHEPDCLTRYVSKLEPRDLVTSLRPVQWLLVDEDLVADPIPDGRDVVLELDRDVGDGRVGE